MQLAMVGDKLIEASKLDLAYQDFGTFFGDGVYEVLRSYNGKLFAFDEHMARFERSLKEIEIEGVDIKNIREKVVSAWQKSGYANAKIYFHITRGAGIRDHAAEGLTPRFLLIVSELHEATEQKEKGITVMTVPDTRWKRCDIKSLNLLPNVLAKRKAHRNGCEEAIFVDDKGYVTEGSSSAFFTISKGKLITSPLAVNILPSVTRLFVMKIYEAAGLKLVEKQIKPAQCEKAGELFIAVSSKDIVPVVKFDNQIIGDGKPGKYTIKLMEEFQKLVK
jgi:D-alanine transaminase